MRVALISDIHGNLAALEAVLEVHARHPPDEVIVLGDIINGAADSKACWDLVKAKGYTLLRGNHERYLFDFDTPRAEPNWSTPYFAPVHWTLKQFSSQELQEMALLPSAMFLKNAPEVFVCHASAKGDKDSVSLYHSEVEIQPLFPQEAKLIIRGHNHVAFQRELGSSKLFSLGSVGLPLSGKVQAEFAIAEKRSGIWQLTPQAIPYDVHRTVKNIQESGLLAEGGVMARLFLREIATGSYQVVPFLNFFRAHCEGMGLEEGLERFLNAY
ncbi:MAG: metallophosphoesterase family protein [Deinococcales bacterium]